jgi:hypothetical protein
MKVIIKESQLDNIIDKYITSQLGNLMKKEEKVWNRSTKILYLSIILLNPLNPINHDN